VKGLSGLGRPGHVALTFDDGPDPKSTPAFLELLERHRVRATFFLLGSMLRDAPQLGREIMAAGHELGLHGDTHRCLLLRGPRSTRDDLVRGRDVLAELTGRAPYWYRPPYGVLTTAATRFAGPLGLRPVLWTTWGRDWRGRATPQTVYRTVERRLAGGGTILLHDSDCTSAPGSWRRTLAALPRILAEIDARGLRVGPLREHGL
jgi:peptidoglycan/xylan/chitin deacetylase (PgdA/CDA1 family)